MTGLTLPPREMLLFYLYAAVCGSGLLYFSLVWLRALLLVRYWQTQTKHQALDAIFFDVGSWLLFFVTLIFVYLALFQYPVYREKKQQQSLNKIV